MSSWFQAIRVAALAAALAACGGRVQIDPESDSGVDALTAGGTGGSSGTTPPTGMGGAVPPSGTGAAGGAGPSGAGGVGGSVGGTGAGGGNPPPVPPPADTCEAVFQAIGLGSWIAFDSDAGGGLRTIFMMHPNRSDVRDLTLGHYIDKEPSFSPDLRYLSFTSDRTGPPQIFLLDLVTLQARQVTSRPEGADQSSFSRDGKLIAFHSGASVFVINPDGTGERRVATGLDNLNAYFFPEFSADGTELVFDRNNEINAERLDGSGLRQIIQNTTTTIKAPAVSIDGLEIAYSVYCQTGPAIVTAPFGSPTRFCSGARVTQLDNLDEVVHPAWASSGFIAYERFNRTTKISSIAVVSRSGAGPTCIVGSPALDSRNPTWHP